MNNISNLREKTKELPRSPGVYYFYDKDGRLLYIGKAASLRARVGSYFFGKITPGLPQYTGQVSLVKRGDASPQGGDRGGKTQVLVNKIADVKIKKTESVLEALILEANEIKKYLPPYNVRAKDDKTFVNIVITKEEFPRVLVARPTEKLDCEVKKIYGPYTSAKSAREAIKILRKIFPFHSSKDKSEKKCLDFHIGLCPGPYNGAISKEDYMKNIRRIEAVLKGKKKGVIRDLEREMKKLAGAARYEEAAKARDKIFALKHVQDVALVSIHEITRNGTRNYTKFKRVEAYDISNISGKYAVGSMVVFEDGEIAKDEYRRFKIRTVREANDIAMLREVLERRFKHTEWQMPDLILIDGGKAQVNAAAEVVGRFYPPLPPFINGRDKTVPLITKETCPVYCGRPGVVFPIIGVAKGLTRKKLDLYFADGVGDKHACSLRQINKKLIAHIMAEAHRFAITYHRLLRKRGQF